MAVRRQRNVERQPVVRIEQIDAPLADTQQPDIARLPDDSVARAEGGLAPDDRIIVRRSDHDRRAGRRHAQRHAGHQRLTGSFADRADVAVVIRGGEDKDAPSGRNPKASLRSPA